jgi:hypothetical protein
MNRSKWVILRDLAIFQVKLAMDGVKDIVFMPLSIMAALLDLVFPGRRPGHRFYLVLRTGEKFDGWLNLFGAAKHANAAEDGLFGASRAGSPTLLGRLEALVLGRDEPAPDDEPLRRRRPAER